MLKAHGDWMEPGAADEQKPVIQVTRPSHTTYVLKAKTESVAVRHEAAGGFP
jgi:hypothetical protein